MRCFAAESDIFSVLGMSGWRFSFVFYAIPSLVVAVIIVVFAREPPREVHGEERSFWFEVVEIVRQ